MKLQTGAKSVRFSWVNCLALVAFHLVAFAFMFVFITWQAMVVCFLAYVLTGMVGITFGYHRLLTHKSLKVPRWLENLAALCGALALQGGPVSWVAMHRLHHAYSDQPEDPHDATKGFWHAHLWNILFVRQDLLHFEQYRHYAPDLAKRPFLCWLDRNLVLVQVVFGLLLFGLGGLLGGAPGFDWYNAWSFVIWGIPVRLILVYHITWFVNSACHLWGSNPNQLNDLSKNNWWVGILAFGEGWHNNHHAQPAAARHGWKWWQLDATWLFIQVLRMVGLAREVVLPKPRPPLPDPENKPVATAETSLASLIMPEPHSA
ncbi:MAG: acyl-CoA desaturase [Gemmataceae bacterium]